MYPTSAAPAPTTTDPQWLGTPATSTAGAPIQGRGLHGLQLFARYAYPPNQLGYCGPEDHRALFDYAAAGVTDPGLAQLARGFVGPWPYLTLTAGSNGVKDPFDVRVVEAYWLGNHMLDQVDMTRFGNTLIERFRPMAGSKSNYLTEAVPAGGVPDHNFHVFAVYPWVGLLYSGSTEQPLYHLDRCRIRWGRVVSVQGDQVVVRNRCLTWDGKRLGLGAAETETVERAVDGTGYLPDLRPGEWVSLHWHWVCDRLSRRQLANLRSYTAHQLDVTNNRVAHSGPGMALS
jgi:hypothetical protein